LPFGSIFVDNSPLDKARQRQFMRALTIFFLSFIGIGAAAQNKDCVLKKESDGVLVYTCKSENERFKSIKATFTIAHTTTEELVAWLKKVDQYTTWQYNMISAKLLKAVSEDTIIVRTEMDAPWPVENRELIVEYSFLRLDSTGRLKVTTHTVSFEYPASEDVVRVPFSHAEWDVTNVGDALQVTYTMKIDPGGSVPAWLVNMAMADGPHESFTKLKKLLE
jgi:hypothetical protein